MSACRAALSRPLRTASLNAIRVHVDLAKCICVIDHRGKEIDSLNQCIVLGNPIHACIVRLIEPYEKIWVSLRWKAIKRQLINGQTGASCWRYPANAPTCSVSRL